jgi:hypothetical protein
MAPVAASHSRTILSLDADATTLPLGENATEKTQSVCPSSFCGAAPVAASQSRTVSSHDADANTLPSGEKATEQTQPVCPSSFCSPAPVAVSQSRTVLSIDADATTLPAGEKITDQTPSVCPSSFCTAAPALCALDIGSAFFNIVFLVVSCHSDATGFLPAENVLELLSSDLLVMFGSCNAAEESLVANTFAKMTDLSVGIVASSLGSCPVVNSESKVGSGLRTTVIGLETADKLLSDTDNSSEGDSW